MLITAKYEKIKNLVNECGSDSKGLYKLVDEITGKKSENKLPVDKEIENWLINLLTFLFYFIYFFFSGFYC